MRMRKKDNYLVKEVCAAKTREYKVNVPKGKLYSCADFLSLKRFESTSHLLMIVCFTIHVTIILQAVVKGKEI